MRAYGMVKHIKHQVKPQPAGTKPLTEAHGIALIDKAFDAIGWMTWEELDTSDRTDLAERPENILPVYVGVASDAVDGEWRFVVGCWSVETMSGPNFGYAGTISIVEKGLVIHAAPQLAEFAYRTACKYLSVAEPPRNALEAKPPQSPPYRDSLDE